MCTDTNDGANNITIERPCLFNIMHLSSSSPRGGGPRAVGGEIGDFVGILQHISAPIVGEMKGP